MKATMNTSLIISAIGIFVAVVIIKAYLNRDIRCPSCGECARLDRTKRFWVCESCDHKVMR